MTIKSNYHISKYLKLSCIFSILVLLSACGADRGNNNDTPNSGALIMPLENSWTWISGESTGNNGGVYGIKGIANSANIPGARYGGASFTDKSSNLWLFGGIGCIDTTCDYLNDLWKYNIQTNAWTWVSGESTLNNGGVYGTKGIANSANIPGARYSGVSFTDKSGNLWLFGGFGRIGTTSGSLNDLWKYNIQTNQWTWISGESTLNNGGVYGTKGVANSANIPGARSGGVSFTDKSGNLWIFGGFGCISNTTATGLNDLWKYNIQTNQWTWISGESTGNNAGVYGIKGVANSANMPGAREYAVSFTDKLGNLWLFGGHGSGIFARLNDLWKYNIQTNQWTWISGESTLSNAGVYGTKGVANSTNMPASRHSAVSFTDKSGNLWLFGGYGGITFVRLNDLWKYNIQTNQWTWISGESTLSNAGVYGIKGVANSTNMPGARDYAVSFTDESGNLWLFGGHGDTAYTLLNDLWKYHYHLQ